MATIQVKGYIRKNKYGKAVTVKSYSRGYSRAGQKKATAPDTSSGQEYTERKQAPKLSREQILAEEARLGYDRYQDYGRVGETRRKGYTPYKESVPTKPQVTRKKQDTFSRMEDKLATFVDKHSKRKYKKVM